jgi:hypothetical protein
MPTSPSEPMRLLKVTQAGQCAASRKPDSGRRSSSRIILGIAVKVGSHFQGLPNLLIRIPIRKTTKSPSISAVTRFGRTFAVALPFASTAHRLSADA